MSPALEAQNKNLKREIAMSGKDFIWRCISWIIVLIPLFCFLIQLLDIFKVILVFVLVFILSVVFIYLVLRGVIGVVGVIYWSLVGVPEKTAGEDNVD